jgi:Peptidase family M28
VRKTTLTTTAAIAMAVVGGLAWRMQAQAPAPPASPIPTFQVAADKLYTLEDGLLHWPLAAADKAYSAIDGKHLHEYVADMTAISRRYRDSGHPQFWGRIIGTSADDESQQWWLGKFKQFGLSDVRLQPFDLAPQWMPQSWSITTSAGGKTLSLDTAQPAYGTPGTTGDGLDVEAMWLGTGSEADYIGRNVQGKAVFFASEPLPGSWRHTATAEGAVRLAEQKGAAAIFIVIQLPGNIRTQLYPTNTNIPTFSLGMNDGYLIRDAIGKAGAQPPHLKVRLEVKMEPGRKTATVWGTLPGATDETIYVLGHRDGWFESATDNGSGVATTVGLAEYFSKIPQAQRRRTIVFVGTSGHHNSANMSGTWLLEHRDELFGKTALMINAEHTATIQTYLFGPQIRRANMQTGLLWYAGGPRRPKLQEIAVKAFRDTGVVTYAEPERAAPGGEMSRLWPIVPGVQGSDYNMFFHSDHETADTVPWTGLEAITRAYAKIIDGVNTLPLSDLQRPPDPTAPAAAPATPAPTRSGRSR